MRYFSASVFSFNHLKQRMIFIVILCSFLTTSGLSQKNPLWLRYPAISPNGQRHPGTSVLTLFEGRSAQLFCGFLAARAGNSMRNSAGFSAFSEAKMQMVEDFLKNCHSFC